MTTMPLIFKLLGSSLQVSFFGAILLQASCESKDLARTDAPAKNTVYSAPTGPESQGTEVDSESIVPPQNITGSYLVQCESSDVTLATTTGTRILCSLQDSTGNKSSINTLAWSIDPAPGASDLLGQELLPTHSKWHVAFLLRAEYFQQNSVEVLAKFGTPAEEIRLDKKQFSTPATGALMLVDRTADLNHQGVVPATVGTRVGWSKIYQDPVTSLFVSNLLDGGINFTDAENVCAQLDGMTALQGRWRLPSRQDLTLLYWLRADLIADFSDWFWTSETVSDNPSHAYYGILYDGQIFPLVKTSSSLAFFCVADQLL